MNRLPIERSLIKGELEEVTVHRCRQLLQQTERVRGLTCYHWWPEEPRANTMGN